MQSKNKIIKFKSKKRYDFRDVTDKVLSFVEQSGVKDGLVNVQLMHTSAALVLNENEPLLKKDIKRNLEHTAPKSLDYEHDDFKKRTVNLCADECVNGHAHCQAIHLQPSITLNFIKKKLQIGQWQKILFIELDQARKRKIQIQIIGE